MADYFDQRQPEESTFNSFLRYLGRPGWALRNTLDGNFEGAGRQLLDTAFDTLDAFVPWDVIPELSRKQDFTEASDLAGGMEDGWGKTAVDILGGVALDPLTYVSFGAAPAVTAAGKGLRVVDDIARSKALRMANDVPVPDDVSSIWRAVDKAKKVDNYDGGLIPVKSKLNPDSPPTYVSPNAKQEWMDEQFQTLLPDAMRDGYGDIATELGAHLSNTGRATQKANPAFIDDIVAKTGGDVDEILDILDGSSDFNQGGMRFRVPFTDIGTDTMFAGKNLDPLSNVGAQLSKIPGAKQAGALARDTFGMDNASAAASSVLNTGQTIARNTQKAGQDHLGQILSGYSPEAQSALVKAFHGVDEVDGVWNPLQDANPLQRFEDYNTQYARLQERLAQTGAQLDPAELERLMGSGSELLQHNMNNFRAAIDGGGMAKPQMYTDAAGQTHYMDDIAQQTDDVDAFIKENGLELQDIPENMSPSMYLHRIIDGVDDADDAAKTFTDSSSIASRNLKDSEQLANYLNEGKGTLNLDLSQSVAENARHHGQLMGRASIGRQILGDSYVHVDKASREALDAGLKNMGEIDPDAVKNIEVFMNGMGERNGPMKLLATSNRYFKPFAVYGAIIPKFGSIVRNKMGMAWQAASVDATRSGALDQLKTAVPDLIDSVSEAYWQTPKSAMGQARRTIDEAFKQAGGQADNAIEILKRTNPELAEAAQHGVLDGFVRSEDLVKEINHIKDEGKWRKAWDKIFDAPGVMFNAIESNGRLGMFLHLRGQGMSAANAAQSVGEAFLDYSVKSGKNRALRDLVPFASFLTGSAKQQAQLVSRNPGVGTLANQVFGQDEDGPIYPWMAEQAHVPLHFDDEEGNPYYASGLGIPIEALNAVPNLTGGNAGEELRRGVIANMNPALKTAYSFISGKDPYFDSDFGSYKKDPLTHTESELGGYYNTLAGTGVIQPLASLATTIGKFTDDRKSLPTALLDSLTGIKVQSVDETRALKQMLREYLDDHGEVGEFTGYYAKEGDEDVKELIKMFQRLK